MIVSLDWLLFGNGHGMKSPHWDDAFYWLHDRSVGKPGKGRFYHKCGWFGCQLKSIEWFAPKAGTRRKLLGRWFVVFQTQRKFLRVETTWALVENSGLSLDDENKLIRGFYTELDRVG